MSSCQDSKSLAKHFTHHLRDITVSIRAEVLELFGISYCRPSSMLGVQINEVGEGSEGFLGSIHVDSTPELPCMNPTARCIASHVECAWSCDFSWKGRCDLYRQCCCNELKA